MKIKKLSIGDLVFFSLIILFLIPQTRMQLKVGLNKIISKINPVTIIEDHKQLNVSDVNFKLTGINTPSVTLNSMHGEVIFINFWATWCGPCVAEMPDLQKLYNKHRNSVNFLFITNDNTSKITEFLSRNTYNFPVYQLKTALPEALEHTSIPTTYIIDQKGNIVVRKVGAADWNSKRTNKLLAELY